LKHEESACQNGTKNSQLLATNRAKMVPKRYQNGTKVSVVSKELGENYSEPSVGLLEKPGCLEILVISCETWSFIVEQTVHPSTSIVAQTVHPSTPIVAQTVHSSISIVAQTVHPSTSTVAQTVHPLWHKQYTQVHPLWHKQYTQVTTEEFQILRLLNTY
jgi:hypothetical protein